MTHPTFSTIDNRLVCRIGRETLWLEPVGADSVRVRATMNAAIDEGRIHGLIDDLPCASGTIEIGEEAATLTHGRVRATVRRMPRGLQPTLELAFHDTVNGNLLLQEQMPHILYPNTRHYAAQQGDLWRIETSFKAHDGERFYGLGQHQHGRLDQKGCVIDLLQMNTEVAIPFTISSRGYGLVWNNPGIGRVELAANRTRWVMDCTAQLDYVVIAGEGPAAILQAYTGLTGRPPMMPRWAMGFWQCKLRYRTQDEVLDIARQYKRRGLPLDCLVIDFFNWTRGGEWKFDPRDFPDPAAMVTELESMGIKPMVSIWPAVNVNAENHNEMRDAGYLITHRRGVQASSIFIDANAEGRTALSFYDATHPEARAYHWARVRDGYARHGFEAFWLDANEPEVYPAHPGNLRYHAGDGGAVTNAYPVLHQKGYAEHMAAEGMDEGVLLSRSAWLGTQRYPVVVWSGDVDSTFADFARQVRAGLNMALSGIAWWTTDIGGFKHGDVRDPQFRELMIRWFQYGTFCPVFRLHGFRQDSEGDRRLGRDFLFGGADNEVWSFGERAYEILSAYLHLRERLKPYIADQMRRAHETGLPPMRPLLVDFPDDRQAVRAEDSFLFGPDLLVAPVLEHGARERTVYLPAGAQWTDAWTGQTHAGGAVITADAPLERIPLFLKNDAQLPIAV
ncbi:MULTISPECIES: TIM-barrel domain-containing protein [unclassified Roseitalea]|uniref:glycoside hydrolase family 31 protein n=1 Tax=unclassified Roseitalea TaxID=2639107 RepID=UPI00273E9D35|nr:MULTISPECIES: TIM-barrel domain-containing protein [unclassified Roseitalea]